MWPINFYEQAAIFKILHLNIEPQAVIMVYITFYEQVIQHHLGRS